MLDARLRARLDQPLARIARPLADRGVSANMITLTGLGVGAVACVAIALDQWWLGLAMWIVNRAADGLDGPVARQRGATDLGGFLDIIADFAVYGGVLVAIAVAEPQTRLAALVTLFMYYLSGSSFLAFSSLATKRRLEGDGRSLQFPAGLAEGTETILAYIVILAWRDRAEMLLWVWAAIVAITLVQRIAITARLLRS